MLYLNYFSIGSLEKAGKSMSKSLQVASVAGNASMLLSYKLIVLDYSFLLINMMFKLC